MFTHSQTPDNEPEIESKIKFWFQYPFCWRLTKLSLPTYTGYMGVINSRSFIVDVIIRAFVSYILITSTWDFDTITFVEHKIYRRDV